jgi:outer membrane receptor protein involved in Fe transport
MRRTAIWAVVAALIMAVTVLAPASHAGTTGKLTGVVKNEKGQPVVGANIRIEGLRIGALSDDDGLFLMLGIPAGEYTLRANLLGYAPVLVEHVAITPDFTTELNIALKTEAVQLGEVRVEAERPLLQKDATGTTRFISADDIRKLPSRGYRDAAAQQTGVVNFARQIDNEAQNQNTLIVRGGRPNEIAYYVDGFSQQDPLTGTSSTSISNNAIEEIVLLTGGFAPEYGRIMSGAVNVITREGASKYFGALEGVTDNLAGDWAKAPKTDYNVYDASLGGPVLPKYENLTFYMSGERRWQADRSPTPLSDVLRNQFEHPIPYSDDLPAGTASNTDFKPNNSSSGYTWQGKLAWALSDQVNVKVGTLGSQDKWRRYAHEYLFDSAHMPRYKDDNQSYFGTVNHALSPRTFYNVGVNLFSTERKRGDGVAFDDLNPHYNVSGTTRTLVEDGDIITSHNGVIDPTNEGYYRNINPRFNTELPMFFSAGHVNPNYTQRKSSYIGAQASLSSQLDAHNQIKAGADFQRHTLRYFRNIDPTSLGGPKPNLVDYDAYGYSLLVDYKDVVIENFIDTDNDGVTDDTTFTNTKVASGARLVENGEGDKDGPKHPKTWALFVQDKFEREGVIVNGGLRFDHINVDTQALRSEQYPLGEPGTQNDSLQNLLDSNDLVANRTYARLSPRLGVAFPVDEKTILRFNYGQFYQQPNLQDLYVSYRYLEYKVKAAGYYYGFGNPNLKPERTTAYETGFQRQVGENVRLDVTAYYKDVKDLVEVANIPAGAGAKTKNFASYRNRDFATVKGVDFGFTMRPVNHIAASLNYSLSFAQGTGSVSNTQGNIAWTADHPPKQTAPLDFDQRHKLSMNLDLRLGKGEGPLLGNFRPLENAGINVLVNAASGTPYTPAQVFNEVTLAAVTNLPIGPINSRYGPWTMNVDAKASRGFQMGPFKLEAYAWVLNVFNRENAIAVYTSSGAANTTNWLTTNAGQGYLDTAAGSEIDGETLYHLAETDPNLFSNPRMVRFGLRGSF